MTLTQERVEAMIEHLEKAREIAEFYQYSVVTKSGEGLSDAKYERIRELIEELERMTR